MEEKAVFRTSLGYDTGVAADSEFNTILIECARNRNLTGVKNAFHGLSSRLDSDKRKISELEDRSLENHTN